MEIARVDPYLARWSADGVLALATESVGLVLLSVDARALLNNEVRWIRHRPLWGERKERQVLDMRWSPTLVSSSDGCLLACLKDSGAIDIVEVNSEAHVTQSFESLNASAVGWDGSRLVYGTKDGQLHAMEAKNDKWRKTKLEKFDAPPRFIVSSDEDGKSLGVVLSDNSAYTLQSSKWVQVTPPSRFVVNAADLGEFGLLSLRSGVYFRDSEMIHTASYLPGHILKYQSQAVVVHADGQQTPVPGSNGDFSCGLEIPTINGDLLYGQIHPNLPVGIVLLATGSAAIDRSGAESWKHPIVSSQNANIYLFPIQAENENALPRRTQSDAVANWLCRTVNELPPCQASEPSLEGPNPQVSLKSRLRALFLSPWADFQRSQWSEANKLTVELAFRAKIVEILASETPESPVDKLVMGLYLNDPKYGTDFSMHGDAISDSFTMQIPSDGMVYESQKPRTWRRCVSTLLPILSLDRLQSADGSYACYSSAPNEINGEDSPENPISDALLEAVRFCFLNGVAWKS